jgi:hypothetical protein
VAVFFHTGMAADLTVYRSLLRGVTVVVANPLAGRQVLLGMAQYMLDAEGRAELAQALPPEPQALPADWRPPG